VAGLLLLAEPGATTVILVQVLGIWWLASGIVHVASIFVDSKQWGWKLASGVLGIIAGLITVQHPLWSAVVLPTTAVFLVGMFGLLFGVIGVISAFRGAGWGTGILGALSIVFGLMLMADPVGSAVALPFLLGLVGIGGGAAGVVAAFRERSIQKHPPALRAV
jgi:uncharacterized membrane protein HdeD (DUF308 family)